VSGPRVALPRQQRGPIGPPFAIINVDGGPRHHALYPAGAARRFIEHTMMLR